MHSWENHIFLSWWFHMKIKYSQNCW
jgi:hypothetical protein